MINFMFLHDTIEEVLRTGTQQAMTDKEFLERQISDWVESRKRREMIKGEEYYRGLHDIRFKQRTAIGEGGKLVNVTNLPNNKICDNQYRKLVNQKKNYLVGRPFTVQTEDDNYTKLLQNEFDKSFMKKMKLIAENAYNSGICWLYVGYDESGQLSFKVIKAREILPFWHDIDHETLDAAVRLYEVTNYNGHDEEILQKVEVYDANGITYFDRVNGSLVPAAPYHQPYFTVGAENPQGYNWSRIPLIAFKYNNDETPLIRMVKSVQDGLNKIESAFEDGMEENPRNSIMVLVNYDGENLGEFRRNLSTYGAVKVRSSDGVSGDVRTLNVEVNAENYRAIIDVFRKAIIENGMGYDAKDERMAGTPNQMNIKSMYSDIDLDANETETEFQASMEQLIWFVDMHLANTGAGDYTNVPVEVTFNRDIMVNESETIDDVNKSTDLSLETRLSHHPWVNDVDAEIKRIDEQKEKDVNLYGNAFNGAQKPNGGGDEGNAE